MSIAEDFAAFWQRYPRRIGKIAAFKAYQKARKVATADELLDGIEQYKRAKPEYADFCHPTTFLNQGRWMDEGPTMQASYEWHCPHTPRCPHRAACSIVSARRAG